MHIHVCVFHFHMHTYFLGWLLYIYKGTPWEIEGANLENVQPNGAGLRMSFRQVVFLPACISQPQDPSGWEFVALTQAENVAFWSTFLCKSLRSTAFLGGLCKIIEAMEPQSCQGPNTHHASPQEVGNGWKMAAWVPADPARRIQFHWRLWPRWRRWRYFWHPSLRGVKPLCALAAYHGVQVP